MLPPLYLLSLISVLAFSMEDDFPALDLVESAEVFLALKFLARVEVFPFDAAEPVEAFLSEAPNPAEVSRDDSAEPVAVFRADTAEPAEVFLAAAALPEAIDTEVTANRPGSWYFAMRPLIHFSMLVINSERSAWRWAILSSSCSQAAVRPADFMPSGRAGITDLALDVDRIYLALRIR